MVPQNSSTTSKSPPVSYADRAKQAQKQNSRTAPLPNSQSSQRVQRDSQAGPTSAAKQDELTLITSGASASTDNPQPPLAKQVSHSSSAKASSQSDPSPNAENDVKIEQTDLPGAISQVSSQKASNPPVNPWNVRKEQLNGHATTLASTEQPISSPNFSSSIPPSVEEWPTIGSIPAPSATHRNLASATGVTPEIAITDSSKEVSVSVPKKGDKKWLPVPPEELHWQTASDAQRQQTRSQTQTRSRSQHANGQPSASGSRSGTNSQQQSRTHSATGARQSTSQSGSAAHSQPHSRVGSVHSSPRQASLRTGRRLPGDGQNSSANRSARSSRATSPQRHQVRNQHPPLPVPPLPPSAFQSLHLEGEIIQSPSNAPPAFYQPAPAYPVHPPSFDTARTHSYHSTHATNSPASNSYALPPPQPYPYYPVHQYYPTYNSYGHPWDPAQMYGAGPVAPGGGIHHPQAPTSPEVPVGVPPPTMISRPPPPDQSIPVNGYRNVDFVLAPPAPYQQPDTSGESEERDDRPRQISFGSIDLATSQSSSPAVASPPPTLATASGSLGLDVNGVRPAASDDPSTESLSIEKSFAGFTIGVTPEDVPRSRSKTAPIPKPAASNRDRVETAPAILLTATSSTSEVSSTGIELSNLHTPEQQKVPDLTANQPTTWEFGTTNSTSDISAQSPPGVGLQQQYQPQNIPQLNGIPPHVPPSNFVEQPYPSQPLPPHFPMGYPHYPPPPVGVPMSTSPPSSTSPYPPSTMPPPMASPSRSSDDFQVKNFGYGFGRGVAPGTLPPGPPPHIPYEDPRDPRHSEYHFQGRPRRGSYGVYDRGGPPTRRGRGRGPRGFSRGNFQHHQHHQSQHHRPPFPGTPPNQFPPVSEPIHYPTQPVPQPHISGTTYFHPAAYEPYYGRFPAQPPPPHLATTSPSQTPVFQGPLPQYSQDAVHHRLLPQLEYYLSDVNLAKDLWLRRQMDSQGWLSISLIASFNRVQQLTLDEQLVRETLSRSRRLEVRDNYVRVLDWNKFVLPDAPKSVFDEQPSLPPHTNTSDGVSSDPSGTNVDLGRSEEEGEDAETEDDEVEFVLGTDANGSWTSKQAAT